jgi:hypothetical protein
MIGIVAAKPETRFTAKVLRSLPKTIYHMKNNNPYTGGIPDLWFSGVAGDLWVEMKYLSRVPQRGNVSPMKLLSPLQAKWLHDRHAEGRAVGVIIGCPTGGAIFINNEWENEITAKDYVALVHSAPELAAWITDQVE